MLELDSLVQVGTNRDDLIAYRICGAVRHDAMDALAAHLNEVFDRHDRVDVLMIVDQARPVEAADTFDWDAIRSWFRAAGKVGRLVIVAQEADAFVQGVASILPVPPEVFDEEVAAWRALGAHVVAA